MQENKASIQGRLIRDLIAQAADSNLMGKQIKSGEFRKRAGECDKPWKCPQHLSFTVVEKNGCRLELLQEKEKDKSNTDKVILQVHGGGYIGGMHNAYRMFAKLYNQVSQGMSVLTVDYRIAPKYPYPAALEDTFTAYDYLLSQGWNPQEIILAGDSAGGGLAMGFCHYLKDNGMELPGGIIAMSPWTDLTASGESYIINFKKDPLFGNTNESMLYNRDYAGKNDVTNPYISPLFGDFTGFPPMLIQVGSYEMLLSDSVRVAEKARQQGVKVHLSIYEGMFHLFQMAAKILPESKRAWKEIGKFMDIMLDDGNAYKRKGRLYI